MKRSVLHVFALAALGFSSLGLHGCSGAGTAPGAAALAPAALSQRVPNSVAAVVTTQVIGVDNHGGITKLNDPTYGEVWGYFLGTTEPSVSQVVTIAANTPVKFVNVDSTDAHTVAFLGDATASGATWPATFNGGTIKSAANAIISTPGWNTGLLKANATSRTYNSGPPGYYMIGCKIHYSHGMRTIVIVQ